MYNVNTIKPIAARLLSGIVLVIIWGTKVFGQANIVLDQPNTGGIHVASQSITLSPGFTSANGFHAYINGAANCVPLATNFSDNQNYIVTSIVKVAGVPSAAHIPNKNSCEVNQTIQYFDGLGRPLQTVQVKGNADATKDVVQLFVYDELGREIKKFLPYAATGTADGSYKADALNGTAGYSNSGQYHFYNDGSAPVAGLAGGANTAPYSEAVYETSPLNRVLEQGAPGAPWQLVNHHTIKAVYDTNIGGEVAQWSVTSNGAAATSNYAAGELFKTISKDENWTALDLKAGTTEEFKDKEGHVVLKRMWETDAKSLSTYYVYDDAGNLRYVLPPAVNEHGQALSSFIETDAAFTNFIYGYHYDNKQRLAEKKIPGKGWEYMVYNKLDQVILTQDANLKGNNQWLFTKYDAFGRTIMAGLYTNAATRASLQTSADAETIFWEQRDNSNSNSLQTGYTNTAMPVSGINAYHSIAYFDDYDFYNNSFGQPNGTTQMHNARTKGLATGTKVNTLGSSTMLLTVNYYDDEGRVLTTKAQNHLGGIDSVANSWDFVGELVASKRTHIANSVTTVIANRYEYDHIGRKKEAYEKINNETEVQLSSVSYNDVGQVLNKALGNSLQTVSYAYNERGWMRTANTNGSVFNMELKYNEDNSGMFNGNISQMNYNTTNVTNPGNRNFTYTYDKLNRLANAAFIGGLSGDNLGEQLSYDVMGNITQIIRSGTGAGTLNYTAFTGNQVNTITGYSARTYAYDDNGNATSDGMGRGITYNKYNLPQLVTQPGSAAILATYTYDGSGQKLRNTGSDGTWDYVNGVVYKNNVIAFITTAEGRAEHKTDGTYNYEYNLKDHLGNNRVSIDRFSSAARIIQEDEYYSFGLRKPTGGYDLSNNNRYLYNGKEIQTDLANQYDYGARFYDPVIARWGHIDPKAELYFQITPYAYAANTPVNAVDPDGHLVIFVNGQHTGSGGTPAYWGGFDSKVKKHFNDYNQNYVSNFISAKWGYVNGAVNGALYLDGAIGGFSNTFNHWGSTPSNLDPDSRLVAGYEHKGIDVGEIINSLQRTNGVITESIKVVAHSMGAAYAKGLIASIIEYARKHPEECRGLSITEYDFAAYQQNQLRTVNEGVTVYQFDNQGDNVVGGFVGRSTGSHHAKLPGRDEEGSNDNVNPKGGHGISDFTSQIMKLAPGKYKFENGEFVKTK